MSVVVSLLFKFWSWCARLLLPLGFDDASFPACLAGGLDVSKRLVAHLYQSEAGQYRLPVSRPAMVQPADSACQCHRLFKASRFEPLAVF
jgi:hypothetical protein